MSNITNNDGVSHSFSRNSVSDHSVHSNGVQEQLPFRRGLTSNNAMILLHSTTDGVPPEVVESRSSFEVVSGSLDSNTVQGPFILRRGMTSTNIMATDSVRPEVTGRHSSYDVVTDTLDYIFEPRNSFLSNTEPMRNVITEPLQTHSLAEIHERESVHVGAILEERKTTHTMPSIASYCCRFCQLGDENEPLISPCKCKGSLAYIHYSCLTKWLNQSGRNTCELCQFRFNTEERMRYTLHQSLRIWMRHPRNRPYIKTIFLISGCLTLFIFLLILLVFIGRHHFLIEGRKLGIAPYWITGSISFFVIFMVLVYFMVLYILFKDQFRAWYRWWHRCVIVKIIIDPNTVKMAPPHPTTHEKSTSCEHLHANDSSSSESVATTSQTIATNRSTR